MNTVYMEHIYSNMLSYMKLDITDLRLLVQHKMSGTIKHPIIINSNMVPAIIRFAVCENRHTEQTLLLLS